MQSIEDWQGLKCDCVKELTREDGFVIVGRASRANHLPKMARSLIRRPTDTAEPSVIMSSHMCVYKADSEAVRALSMDWFVESALRYRLSGEPSCCLCQHNANVASGLSRSQVAQTWRLLQLMCSASVTTSHTQPPTNVCSLPTSLQLTEHSTSPACHIISVIASVFILIII